MEASTITQKSEATFALGRCDILHSAPSLQSVRSSTRGVWLLTVVAVILFAVRLPCALLEPEEARHAEIARQMLAEGRWLIPILDGEDYLHKPPLFYWLIMASYLLLGVHDWAARLVVCVAGIGTTLGCYYWARSRLGRQVAFLGALILLLSSRFLYHQGMVLFDSVLCLWVTLGWWWGDRALKGQFSSRYWLASAVACGLGVMTKGPVAGVLIGTSLLFAAWPRVFRLWRQWAVYAGVVGLVAGPWFIYLVMTRPDAAREFFLLHHVQRFTDPFDHAKPWWFFLPSVAVGMLPWSLWIVPAIRTWIYQWRRDGVASRLRTRTSVFWCAGLWCLLFFSLSGCKRPAYVLPAFGPLAIALAHRGSFTRWFNKQDITRKGATCLMLCFTGILAASVIALPGYHAGRGPRDALAPIQERPDLNVYSFPRGWNSVTFYLERPVEVITDEEEFIASIEKEEQCWLVVRRDAHAEVLKRCPESHKLRVMAEHPNVIIGLVVRVR